MKSVAAFLSGLLFATGLVISGMTQPAKVIGFLDVFGAWNPTLAFVMIGALSVYTLLFPLVTRRHAPLFAPDFQLPVKKAIDVRLLSGAAAFGVGWGLMGVCPGPVLTVLGVGAPVALVFLVAMGVGMKLAQLSASDTREDADKACG